MLRFERRRYYYTVKDQEGAVVAKMAPIVGGPGPSRLARFFRAGPYLHRVVLQVTDPMGHRCS
ncbi:MAG: hypothetical protein IRY90_19340 [Actinomadura rubrobrunea]|nr:hypothetical protein [Actinomadura rubrobrunea]